MKRFISVFLSLILMMSLCFAFGSSALAEEGDSALTIVVTGGVGDAIGADGLACVREDCSGVIADRGSKLLFGVSQEDVSKAEADFKSARAQVQVLR